MPVFKNLRWRNWSQRVRESQDEEEAPHDCSELQRQAFEQGRLKGIDEGRAQCQAQS